ncbi:MAG: hypothetical protein RLZZ628_575 [Bacteroidota bacterium]|jgi:hypothetical protein
MTPIRQIFTDFSFLGYTFGYIVIRTDVRISRIEQIYTDFLDKKSVQICSIREIRTSVRITICAHENPSNPCHLRSNSHRNIS